MSRFLPYLLGGAAVGLLAVMVVVGNSSPPTPPGPFDPLAEADDTAAPMADIPAGEFVMGSDAGEPDERPAHPVRLKAFRMEVTEVTNGRFAAFVKATEHITVAERETHLKFPDGRTEIQQPSSPVFRPVAAPLDKHLWGTRYPPWWQDTEGANWRNPNGPGSNLKGKMNHPVVHIAWDDAAAYAKWCGRRLPTEAEWEYAARGGLEKQEFCWGSAKQGTDGKWFANTFQGDFPHGDTGADGFKGTAPVRSFPPNGYGLHDTSGNVWEWCADWYDSTYYGRAPRDNPPGPEVGEPDRGQPQRVRRGGSFLCAEGYCRRYVPSARDKNPTDSGASHTGFRCAE